MTLENPENPIEHKHATEHSEKEAADHSQKAQNPAPPMVAPAETKPCTQHPEITCNKKRDWVDKMMIALEVAGLTVLSLYTIFTFLLWRAQTNALKADQRAWVTWMRGDSHERPFFEGPYMGMAVKFENLGKTPAKHFSANVVIYSFDPSEHLEIVYGPPNHYLDNRLVGIFYPDQKDTIIFWVIDSTGQRKAFSRDEIAIINAPGRLAAIYGTITYDDIFGVHHLSKFCGTFVPKGSVISKACAEYNDTDDNPG